MAVTELGCGLGGDPEGPVECRGVLGRVGHYGGLGETAAVEGRPDRRDLAVHHGGRRHDIRPGLGLADGCPGQQLHGGVVVHAAAGYDAAVAVAGVLAHADVADDDQPGLGLLDGADSLLDYAVFGVRPGAHIVLDARDAEQQDGGDAQVDDAAHLGGQPVDGELGDAGHRLHVHRAVPPVRNEDGIDEVADGDAGLADHVAQAGGAAQPPLACDGEVGHGASSSA